jgi:hypothetical protein
MLPNVHHPLIPGSACPVLQYADDTLIFLPATPNAILAMKDTLQDFELATGLSINYHKTMFLPLGISEDAALELASIFGANISSFPQTYLGLPLSPHKLSVSDCQPVIAACDRNLSGWRASLLNRAGCLTLASAVLSALPLHYMSAIGLHKTVIKAIDRRRRAFFWTREDSCHGSKCLVAWEQVCTSKQFGGLGLKDLELQNQCMLLKFVDKFFLGQHVPWRDWLLQNDCLL